MKPCFYVSVLLLSVVPLPAIAQTGTFPPPPPPMRGTIPPPPPVGGVRAFPPPPQKTPEIPGWSAYNYTRSAEKTKANYNKFVEGIKEDHISLGGLVDEKLAVISLAYYDEKVLPKLNDDVFNNMGLSRTNAADIVTYLLISGYFFNNKLPVQATPQQIKGTRTFVIDKLKGRPTFSNPATKQDLAESLFLAVKRLRFVTDNKKSMLGATGTEMIRSNEFNVLNSASMAALGIDLKSLTLTADGIKISSAR